MSVNNICDSKFCGLFAPFALIWKYPKKPLDKAMPNHKENCLLLCESLRIVPSTQLFMEKIFFLIIRAQVFLREKIVYMICQF